MSLRLLLLLSLLSPGSGFWLWEDGAKAAPGPLLVRDRRQVAFDDDMDEDYNPENTDPPEIIGNSTWLADSDLRLLTTMGTLGQRGSAGPGTPEPATAEVATRDSASLEEGRTATKTQSEGQATEWMPVTSDTLVSQPITEAPSTEGALSVGPKMESRPTGLSPTEALSTVPAATEALSTVPAATEALSTVPAATEALSTVPAATEALTMWPVATEAQTAQPAATEVETTEPTTLKALPTKPTVIEALSTERTTTEAPSTEPSAHEDTSGATHNLSDDVRNRGQVLPPRSSVAPSPTGPPDRMSVKQCLLAILILALVATVFLVCTGVLAVRLSRKTHTYPVRNYSPTEMVCISALLPEGGEGPPATANGGVPKAKSQGLLESGEDRDGDDLTLHSFLP
ncbi:P-selectin glycoprotein ligand 1 [Tupaia chinensis]|uniref:p-selectin glycoprotein ligand 1 n=1 Tax=Tupaia chinensis TaxID=246437 RepID=L9KLG9_TUPCH|nr:P-selectin glycoprotein ligand 1 [Tupaia chinensis]